MIIKKYIFFKEIRWRELDQTGNVVQVVKQLFDALAHSTVHLDASLTSLGA